MPFSEFFHSPNDELFCNFINVRELKSKLVDLNMELSNLTVKFYAILIAKTWFDSDVIISDFIGNYYDVLSKDKKQIWWWCDVGGYKFTLRMFRNLKY